MTNLKFTKYDNFSKTNILYASLLIIIAIIYVLMSYFTPPQYDDLLFVSVYHRYNNGNDNFSLQALTNYFLELRKFDNSRIANLLSPFSTILYPWNRIFPFITGILISVIVYFSLKICNIKKDKYKFTILVWFSMIIFLPWRNSLFVADYSLNYIYAGAISLIFIYLMTIKRDILNNTLYFILMIPLALICGAWHEGFSVAIISGLLMLALLRNLKMGYRWYVILLLFILSTAFIVLCPGIISRSGREIGEKFNSITWKFLFDSAALIILFFILILCALFKIGRIWICRAFSSDSFIVTFTASITAGLLSIIVEHTPRTSFWADLCSIISLFIILHPAINKFLKWKLANLITPILLILCLTQSILSIVIQKRLSDENKIIMSQFNYKSSSTVFHDIIDPKSISLLTLYFPSKSTWVNGFQYRALEELLNIKEPAVVPTILRKLPSNPEILSNNNSKHKIKRINSMLFTDRIHDLDINSTATIKLKIKGSNEYIHSYATLLNFQTETGDSLTYVYPLYIPSDQIEAIEITQYYKKIRKQSY